MPDGNVDLSNWLGREALEVPAMNRSLRLALTAAACAGISSTALAAGDKAFLKKAMEGDNSEMHLGQMAEQGGSSRGLREFGHMLNPDHAKAKADALPVARAHGLAPTDEMAPEAKEEAGKLKGLTGSAFDREFASYMVTDHKKDIADFEKQARTGDRSTARLARATLPTLRRHLAMAERLAR